MQCPVCSKEIADGSKECPDCKADLSRWRPKKESDIPAGPAVILEKKVVVTFRDQIQPFIPYISLLGIVALIAILILGGVKLYFKYFFDTGLPTQEQSEAAAPSRDQEHGFRLSTAGYSLALQDYRDKAASMNLTVLDQEAEAAFKAGADAVLSPGFDEMEAAGMNADGEPFTPEETERAKTSPLACKCSGPAGTEYPAALPSGATDYVSCWMKRTKEVQPPKGAKKNAAPAVSETWVPARWTPEIERWSPWTVEQLLAGAEAKKTSGPEKGEAEAPATAMQLFETYRSRFMKEGAAAAMESLSASLTPAAERTPE